MRGLTLFVYPLFLFSFLTSHSQSVDHWEGLVLAENLWKYKPGNSEPPLSWNSSTFNDKTWNEGRGGIGYGDGDDNTTISPTLSVYLRKNFVVSDVNRIVDLRLYADYDDGFVAFLNGVEIKRSNLPTATFVQHNQTALNYKEANLYQGLQPEVFVLDPSLLKPGQNTLAVQVHNHSINSSDLSANFFLITGVSDTRKLNQSVPGWFLPPFSSSNLPVISVNTGGQTIVDEPKIQATMKIVDNGGGQRNSINDHPNGYNGKIGIELRGASSLSFPKKNYTIETRLDNGENNNISLLGLPVENDWVLHGPYSDKSLMRNALAYHIAQLTENYAPRTRWCELIIDGDYKGLYVLTEKIKQDKSRVNIKPIGENDNGGEELTGGYIFSADRDSRGSESGWYSQYTDNLFYRFRDPNYSKITTAQKIYLSNHMDKFEKMMDNPASAQFYNQYIDVESFVDYWLCTEVYKHIDNFKFSFYMYKERARKGGKLHFGPVWDLNLGFGNFDFARDPGPTGWSYIWTETNNLRPLWVLELSERPEIQNQLNCRWQELRSGPLRTDSLIKFINVQAAEIDEARKRNFERWSIIGKHVWPNNYVGNTYEEELNYLRNWLINRLNWMDQNMLGECRTVGVSNQSDLEERTAVFPNPFDADLFVDFPAEDYETAQFKVVNIAGAVVLKCDLVTGLNQTEAENLPPGIYFFEISNDQGILKSGKLVKHP